MTKKKINKIKLFLRTKLVGYLWSNSPSSGLIGTRFGPLWY